MITNKKTALIFALISIIYTLLCIGKFFYFNSTLIADLSNPPHQFTSLIGNVVFDVLNFSLFVGMLWTTIVFNEKKWIRFGIIIFLIIKAAITISAYFLPEQIINFNSLFYILATSMYFMLLAMLFVQSTFVKIYFRWISILITISIIMPDLGGYLYDHFFQKNWLLVNKDAVIILYSFVITALFIRVYIYTAETTLSEKAN